MKNKTFWMGFVAIFIVMQVIGYAVHEVMMADTYAALAAIFRPREEMDSMMWMMMLSGAVLLFLFCYIFTKGYEGKGVMEGLRYGALMGVFLALVNVDQHVIYPLPAYVAAIWFVTVVVRLTISGAVFAAIYKPSRE